MTSALETTCCIVGGGPAGMMLGVLLSRAGVRTIVIEEHGDFLRDFRGDTIHPSTLELMHELGTSADALRLHCLHAAVGFPGFSCPSGPAPWRRPFRSNVCTGGTARDCSASAMLPM